MKDRKLERRRALRLIALVALGVPAAVIAGCAQAPREPHQRIGRVGGGNRGGEKSKGGGD